MQSLSLTVSLPGLPQFEQTHASSPGALSFIADGGWTAVRGAGEVVSGKNTNGVSSLVVLCQGRPWLLRHLVFAACAAAHRGDSLMPAWSAAAGVNYGSCPPGPPLFSKNLVVGRLRLLFFVGRGLAPPQASTAKPRTVK